LADATSQATNIVHTSDFFVSNFMAAFMASFLSEEHRGRDPAGKRRRRHAFDLVFVGKPNLGSGQERSPAC
jgi:hypothetical protein